MRSSVCRLTLLGLLGLTLAALAAGPGDVPRLAAQKAEPGKDKPGAKAAPAPTPSTSAREKESDKGPVPLPPNSILAIYDNLADALRKEPWAVVLKPEKYRAMLEEIERLKKQLGRPRLRTPSGCVLKGKVEGNLVQLSAQFDFKTTAAGEQVRLGCGLALATGVKLNGTTPQLRSGKDPENGSGGGEEGFVVEIEKPGDHQLTLDLVLTTTNVPPGQGFTLDLPRAAITRIELDLPPGSRDVRVGGKPVESTLKLEGNRLAGPLGAAENLELSWKPARAASASSAVSAEGTVTVRLDAAHLTTEARLTLRSQGGQVKTYRLVVPQKAEVTFDAADKERIAQVDSVENKHLTVKTIHLKEATSDDLTVNVTHVQPAPRPDSGKPVSVGPFSVLDAVRQFGRVLVSNSVPGWHLGFTPRGDLTQRVASREEQSGHRNLVAAFGYGPGSAAASRRALDQSWLDIETDKLIGKVRTHTAYVVTLDTAGDAPRWQVLTTLTVTPPWSDLGRFVVTLPPGCEVKKPGQPLPDQIESVVTGRTVEYHLNRGTADAAPNSLTVRLETVHGAEVNPRARERMTLELPRPVDTIDKDSTVTVQAPANLELELPEEDLHRGLQLVRQSTHEITWRSLGSPPPKVELVWKPYTPPVKVSSLADVTLSASEVRVHQELRYQLTPGRDGAAPHLEFDVPAEAASSCRLVKGGQEAARPEAGGRKKKLVVAPADPRTPVVVLEYRYPRPEAAARGLLRLPLVMPLGTTEGDSKVRLWSEPGQLPLPHEGWTEQNIEVVPDQPRLPVLVVRAGRADQPFAVRLGDGDAGAPALVERILAVAEIGQGGQKYQVSYRLSRLAARHLDLELPAPSQVINLQISLDGRRLAFEPVAVERAEMKGRQVRVRVSPDLVSKPAVLEVQYVLGPDRQAATTFTTTLWAPRLLGEPGSVPVRWVVLAPPGVILLSPEPGPAVTRRWGWRGWLLAPRLAVTVADLEQWFTGKEAVGEGSGEVPSLVFWQDGAGSVQLWHVPQQAWLLSCSLLLVLAGLVIVHLLLLRDAQGRLPPRSWAGLLALGTAILLPVLLWPSLAAHLAYGGQAGAAVLIALLLLQWLLHERYRRQIIFLSSFSRARPGSSVSRPPPPPTLPARPPVEPSTVDVPRPTGSSVNRPL